MCYQLVRIMQVFKQFLSLMPHYFSTATSSLIRLLFCWYLAGKEEGSRLARRIRGYGADLSFRKSNFIPFLFLFLWQPLRILSNPPLHFL